jgi:hypothetical protein
VQTEVNVERLTNEGFEARSVRVVLVQDFLKPVHDEVSLPVHLRVRAMKDSIQSDPIEGWRW